MNYYPLEFKAEISNLNDMMSSEVHSMYSRCLVYLLLFILLSFSIQLHSSSKEPNTLEYELSDLLNNPDLSKPDLLNQLEQLYLKAISQDNTKVAGITLYIRGENLLNSQHHDEFEKWQLLHQQFYKLNQLEVTSFFIEKLNLNRLFQEMKTQELERKASALMNTVNLDIIRQKSSKSYYDYYIGLKDVADVQNFLGLAKHDLGKYDEALVSFSKALRLYEEAGSQQDISISYGNMALVYASSRDIDSAIEYNTQSIKLSKKIKKTYSFLKGSVNQASYKLTKLHQLKKMPIRNKTKIAGLTKDIENTLVSLLNNVEIDEFPVVKSDTLYWLTYLYLEQKLLAKSEYYLVLLLDSLKSLKDSSYRWQARELEAYILFEKKSYKEGSLILSSALNFYLENNKFDKAMNTLIDISWAYEQLGDFEKGLQYYKDYVYYFEQSFNDKRLAVLAKEQERNNAKLREKEILLLEKQNRVSELLVDNQNKLMFFSLTSAILIILLFWFRLKNKQRLAEQYLHLSHFDALTNIGNRLFFKEHIERELARILRERKEDSKEKLVFFMLDIDHFKKLNDSYGHDVGDKVLIDFAVRLKETIREYDILARWGGEEFVIVGRVKSDDEALTYVKRILLKINSTPFQLSKDKECNVTCSIGGVIFPFFCSNNEPSWEKTLGLADHALYHAKDSGRNTFCICKNSGVSSIEQLDNVLALPIENSLSSQLLIELIDK